MVQDSVIGVLCGAVGAVHVVDAAVALPNVPWPELSVHWYVTVSFPVPVTVVLPDPDG